MAIPSQLRVERIAGLSFGCRVQGVDLASVSDADFDVLATAWQKHGVLLMSTVSSLKPQHEVALYRRFERLWTQSPSPAPVGRHVAPGCNLRGVNPPGSPEVSVLGSGAVHNHHGLNGWIEPTPWWERDHLQWHHDGAFDGYGNNIATWMSCSVMATDSRGERLPRTIRWNDHETAGTEHVLCALPGATLFADACAAYDLCDAEEQCALEKINVRYWAAPTGFGRVRENDFPCMSECGTRVMRPPRASMGHRQRLHSGQPSDNLATFPEYSQRPSQSKKTSECKVGNNRATPCTEFVHPLIIVLDNGRKSLFCHTVNMKCLECSATGQSMSYEDSQALVSRVLRRAVKPDRVLALDWSQGDVAIWDNRRVFHSVTPTNWYRGGQRLMHRISLVVSGNPLERANTVGVGISVMARTDWAKL